MSDKTKEAVILAAADSQVPKLKTAAVQAINELRSKLVDVDALSVALSNGDTDAAIAATHVDDLSNLLFGIGMGPTHYVFTELTRDVFSVGAITALSGLPLPIQTALAFNSLNQRAVNFMVKDGAEMVQEITDTTKQGVRSLIARSLADNLPPAKQVYEIRQLIGLTDSQAIAVMNFRRQLETRQILGFTPPDERRLSAVDQSVIRRHMKIGHLSDAEIDNLVERYYVSLVNKRALDIARTESLNAVNNGQLELWQQARDAGFLSDEIDRQFWLTAGDARVRQTHQPIPSMNPNGVKIGGYFVTPHGLVTGPGTRNPGFINCRCVLVIGQIGNKF
jgi:hypothetical protein